MKLRWLCFVLSICVFTPSTTNNVLAASLAVSSATLSGRVTDPNGLVIAGAKVDATNVGTNVTFSSETNGEGFFVISNISPGRYRVTIEKQGFQSIVKPDVELHVQDIIALNFAMQVGSIIQSVMVESGAPLIQTESAAVDTLVDRQFVENLPLNGRSFQSLIGLTPGVVLTKANSTEQGQFSVNGQRADANYFTIDGVSANFGSSAAFNPGQSSGGSTQGFSAAGGTNNLVSVDALQEFKIQTSTYAPEFGRTPGGQVQIVTRSGTNEFRGNLFEYFRNDVLDANDWFGNANRLKKPALRQNDFGFVLGGPILLPRFGEGGRQPWYNGHNRTFFFFSYEGLRLRQPQVGLSDVPSLTARRTAPASIQPFLNAFPLPTGPDRPNGFAGFAASFSNPLTLDATSVRIDHTVNDKLTLFGRYNYAPSEARLRGGSGNSLSQFGTTKIKTQTLTVGATSAITTSISNEFRANYSRNRGSNFNQLDDFGGATVLPDSVLFPSPFSSQDAQTVFILIGGINTPALQLGKNVSNLYRQVNVVDNLSMVTGSHQLKFGIDYRRLSPFYDIRKFNQVAVFNGVILPAIPGAPGQAMSGRTLSSSVGANDPNTLLFTNFSSYSQDTWRIRPRLTLTYGVRWEYNPPPSGEKELLTVSGLDNPATLTLAPQGTPFYKTAYNNFAPRIGVAYQLSQKSGWETGLRSGFGIFYDLGSGTAGNAVTSFPYVRTRNLPSNSPFPLSSSDATPPAFDLNQQIGLIIVFDPDLKLPRTYQWNFAVEQSLGTNQTVSASYLGAAGRRLLRQERLVNPNTKFADVRVTRNAADSDYNALQLQFQRRFSRNLQALISYTWAKSLDTASNDSTLLTPSQRIDPQLDRGPSDFDVRHAFAGAITYNIPTPAVGKIAKSIIGNFAIDTTITARSATPVNVTYSTNLGFGLFDFRPDLVPGIPLYLDDPTAPGGRRFNNTRVTIPGNPNPQIGPFLRPVQARQGSLGRNALRGFPVYQLDLALRRQFNLGERANLQLRAEFFNILNHPNFGDPIGNLTNSSFGLSPSMLGRSLGSGGVSGGFNPLYQIGGPRSIQFALKLNF